MWVNLSAFLGVPPIYLCSLSPSFTSPSSGFYRPSSPLSVSPSPLSRVPPLFLFLFILPSILVALSLSLPLLSVLSPLGSSFNRDQMRSVWEEDDRSAC